MMKFLLLTAIGAISAAYELPAAAAEKYTIDPQHVWIYFAIQQIPYAKAMGRFTDITGTINLDRDNIEASSVTATIGVASVDTADVSRDAEVKSTFLKQIKFPEITFNSTQVVKTGEATGTMTGDLTINGITKPVTLAVTYDGGGPSRFSGRMTVGFSATGSLNATDFGVLGLEGLGISPAVSFSIEVDAIKD